MKCPNCQTSEMAKVVFYGSEVDYCSKCLGTWFEQDELRWAKDAKMTHLNWLDIDLWDDKKKFKISKGEILCPVCDVLLYEVAYDGSDIKVDICNVCFGVLLDRGEFKKIAAYLKDKEQNEVAKHYFKNLLKEGAEILSGPETLREEVDDFLAVWHLLGSKFAAKHPLISQLILSLPK